MTLLLEVPVFLTAILFGSVRSVSKSVKYEGPSGGISNKIGCAAMSTDPLFVAVRIHEETGTCQGLTWNDWGSSPTYENGYTYLEKKRTFENTNSLTVPFVYNFGSLTDGKTIHVEGIPNQNPARMKLLLQEGDKSKAETIVMAFTVRFNFATYMKVIGRNDKQQGKWGVEEQDSPSFPFIPGVPYNITILYQQNMFTVEVENNHFIDFAARFSPVDHINTVRIDYNTQLTKVVVKG